MASSSDRRDWYAGPAAPPYQSFEGAALESPNPMRKCLLNVSVHEYDRILQLNHDLLAWSNRDQELLHGLGALLGDAVVHEIRQYDECRMQKHDSLDGISRVEPDLSLTAQGGN